MDTNTLSNHKRDFHIVIRNHIFNKEFLFLIVTKLDQIWTFKLYLHFAVIDLTYDEPL